MIQRCLVCEKNVKMLETLRYYHRLFAEQLIRCDGEELIGVPPDVHDYLHECLDALAALSQPQGEEKK